MTQRAANVQAFIQNAAPLFQSERLPEGGRAVAARVFQRLEAPSDDGKRHDTRYPACVWLDAALARFADDDTRYGDVARIIPLLEPHLGWSRRTTGANGSPNYVEGHVHGMICGPGGIESRYDVQLGFTVMAPGVRYPDHSHPPEEAYVLLSPGEFRQKEGEWFDPGIGGGIHNTRNSLHAMKSGEQPFLALWCLLV